MQTIVEPPLEAGLIGVVPSHGFVAWAIRAITRSQVAHAFIATGHGDLIIEGDPHGARLSRARYHASVMWLPGLRSRLTVEQGAAAAGWARQHIGTPYSWIDDAEIGFVDLFGWAPRWMKSRLRSDRTLMCSQLCVEAYRAAGVDLFPGKPGGAVSPGDLLRLEQEVSR